MRLSTASVLFLLGLRFEPIVIATNLRASPLKTESDNVPAHDSGRKLSYWQTCKGSKLKAGERLHRGDCLCNGDYSFCMDDYGSLSLLSDVMGEGYYVWEAPGNGKGDYVHMQKDGNLVVYKKSDDQNVPIWASHTEDNLGGKVKLNKQGVVTIESVDGSVLWAEYEHGCKWVSPREKNQILEKGEKLFPGQYICRRHYRFGMDEEGAVGVFYRADGNENVDDDADDDAYDNDYEDDWDNGQETVWEAGAIGGYWLQMQGDGNLVVYDKDKNDVWATRTNGKHNSVLKLLEGGEVKIVTDIWSVGPFDD